MTLPTLRRRRTQFKEIYKAFTGGSLGTAATTRRKVLPAHGEALQERQNRRTYLLYGLALRPETGSEHETGRRDEGIDDLKI